MIGSEQNQQLQPVTAFLSNIPAGTPDDLVLSILSVFGTVLQWRRLKEPSGALKPSGFADFSSLLAASQAARLLPHVDLHAGAGKRLLVKLDAQLAIPNGEAAVGEEGELMDSKTADCRLLELLSNLFQQRRMMHAADSCRLLCKEYDRIARFSNDKVNVQPKVDADVEQEWLRREERIFKDYKEYMESSAKQLPPSADIERLFSADRPMFARAYPDKAYEEHVRLTIDSIPTDTAQLYAHHIEWSRLSVCKLRRWLVRQRGLSVASVERVISWFVKRQTPLGMQSLVAGGALEDVGVAEGEAFVVRLWRWLILETRT